MSHDCRFCICVSCYPWEEGVHNFRHPYRAEACDCDHCPRERPPYPDYPLGRSWRRAVPPSDSMVPAGSPGARSEPYPPASGT